MDPDVRRDGPARASAPLPPSTDAAILDLVSDAILVLDQPAGSVVQANAAALALFGMARDDVVGRSTERLHADKEGFLAFREALAACEGASAPAFREWRFVRGDGSPFVGRVSLRAVPSAGEPGRVAVVVALVRDAAPLRDAHRGQFHSQVLDSMMEGVSLATAEGVIVYTNPAEDAMFGYERGELVGKHVTVQNAYPPERNGEIVEEVIRQLQARGYWEGEFENVKKDGTPFRTRARITRVEVDGALHWVCVQEDVTDRRRLEQRERENTRALKTLARVQEELARDLDFERVVQTTTDAATLLSGARFGAFFYSASDAEGKKYPLYALSGAPREAFSRFPMPGPTALFQPTMSGERIVRIDDVLVDARYGKNSYGGMPPGHLPVRSYLAVPVVSREGTVHGAMFFGHPDPGRFSAESEELVAAIAAQAAVALDNAALFRRVRESEDRWRKVVANAPIQIITIDENGRLLTINRSVRGIPAESLVGMDVYATIVPEERERVRGVIEQVIRTGQPAEYETRGILGPGVEGWFDVRVAPLEREGRKGAILISTDVTQRKRQEQELSMMRAQLIQGEKLAALGSLVSGVAHELRTPLTFLSNNAFLVQQRFMRAAARGASAQEALEESERFLGEISAGVDRINQLVEDLRRYTKARLDPLETASSLDAMIADAVELFRATNRSRHALETSLSRTALVRGNKGAIQQLVLNLLQNGADASEPGSPLRISTRDAPDGVVLEVVDQGSGIPQEVLDHMYEPLFTTKADGTGLGLSIVRRIVEEHHARIECDTRIGRGTSFRVTFPRAPDA